MAELLVQCSDIDILKMTMTMTMTTLIEDGSNKSWASGPVGMSDGVMTPSKKSDIRLKDERCWLQGISKDTVNQQCVENCAGRTNSSPFDSSLTALVH